MTTELREIAPRQGSRNGWHYKCHLRIGRAKVARREGDGFEHYGLYGSRRAQDGAWELFAQWEGRERPDGSVYGKTLLASSQDLGAYVWCPAEWFTDVRFF